MYFKNGMVQKNFIKEEAERLEISPMAAYTTYYARMLLERLALINYGELVVKGSFSQYVHLGKLIRPVLDIDLSSLYFHQVPLQILREAILAQADDNTKFEIGSKIRQTQNGVYKIPVVAKIKYDGEKEMVFPVPIDFKENNKVIFETQFKAVEPLFTDDQKFYINVPSFEEHIAEKMYVVAHNNRANTANTRVKDFYDVYEMLEFTYGNNHFDADKVNLYFQTMLILYNKDNIKNNYKTLDMEKINTEFLDKKFVKKHQALWDAMRDKYQFIYKDVDLDETVYYIRRVLRENINKIRDGYNHDQAVSLARKMVK